MMMMNYWPFVSRSLSVSFSRHICGILINSGNLFNEPPVICGGALSAQAACRLVRCPPPRQFKVQTEGVSIFQRLGMALAPARFC